MKTTHRNIHDLSNFAVIGNDVVFNKKLNYLEEIAEQEKWQFDDAYPYSILRYYVFYTFRQCHIQNKLSYSADRQWCCVNIGLLTKNGKDIVMIFQKNAKKSKPEEQDWFFKTFKSCDSRDFLNYFSVIPQLATYTNNYEDYYYDPELPIDFSADHIFDDHWERIKAEVNLDKEIVKYFVIASFERAKTRVKRNMRLVVPQLYNDKIMYFLPLEIPVSNEKTVVMALAIEKTPANVYRANTIFTRRDAYQKARLLMKPEANWLIE